VIDILNGAMNVVPGEVEIKIDIRSTSVASRKRVLDHLYQTISVVQENRQLVIESTEIISEEPVLLSDEISQVLESICEEKRILSQRMISGAGHDAMNMNKLCPVGLIFVPSVDGLSHHPNEFTDMDDIIMGIDILEEAVLRYAYVRQT
jgi:N-carbamoyl-L-amino-acid hydrolase